MSAWDDIPGAGAPAVSAWDATPAPQVKTAPKTPYTPPSWIEQQLAKLPAGPDVRASVADAMGSSKLGQFAHGVLTSETGGGMVQALSHLLGNGAETDQKIKSFDDAYQASRAKGGEAPGIDWASGAGNVVPYVVGGAENALLKLPQAGGNLVKALASRLAPSTAKTLGNIGTGATLGAESGLLSTETGGEDYASQKAKTVALSTALGGAIPVAGKAITSVYDAAKPFVNPTGVVRAGLEKAGVDPAQLAQALKSAQEFVPGSKPTTAQVAAVPGQPNPLVQIEQTLRNNPETRLQFNQRDIGNNQARWDALNSVADTDASLTAAQGARTSAAAPLYESAFTTKPKFTPDTAVAWKGLQERPAIQEALAKADTLAKNEGKSLGDNSVEKMHFAKLALDDAITSATTSGNKKLARSLLDSQNELVSLMGNISPKYAKAMEAFKSASPPINAMEAGQSIAGKLAARGADQSGNAQITLPGYTAQLASALKGAKFGLPTEAETALRGIQSDLQRASISNGNPVAGSNTKFNLDAPGWLNQLGKSAPFGLDNLSEAANKKVAKAYADALLNPEVAAKLSDKSKAALLAQILSKKIAPLETALPSLAPRYANQNSGQSQ